MAQIHALSILDQLPFMHTYTQMLLCFPIEEESRRSEVIRLLQQASANLVEAIPILTGQVENYKDAGADEFTSGTLRVVPYDHPDGSNVRVKILDDFVSYDQLYKAQAPATMLDATSLAPMQGLPHHYGDSDVTPVFIVQANFIPRGLILCFTGMHSTMDGNALGELIKLFATLCRGEKLSPGDLAAANLDRTKLHVDLKPGQTLMNHPEFAKKNDDAQKDTSAGLPPTVWSYFHLANSKLVELKAEGSRDLTSDSRWVSTNDVVTAWLWRTITRARSPNIDMSKESALLRAVDGRLRLDPPLPKYLGNLLGVSSHKLAIETLMSESLSKITQGVRESTNLINDHYIRSIATLIASEPDKNKLTFGSDAPDRDLLVSSWASLPAFDDFGKLLGRADLVRRPTSPWSGVVYIMPRSPDGSLDVAVSLPEDDMLRLRNDEQVQAFATYIG
ncbi:MAG: hypothetical protein Q9209_001198 [Squamulea sp. 1 TL-2023]